MKPKPTIDIQGQHYTLASIGQRLIAFLIDALLVLPLILLNAFAEHNSNDWLDILVSLIVGGTDNWEISFRIYFLVKDGILNGQSFGKRFMRIQVIVEKTGNPCAVGKSIIRNLTTNLFWLIDIVWVFGSKTQRAGDRIAGTLVIKA